MKTQQQMFYSESSKISQADQTFLNIVEKGLTKTELKGLIKKHPKLWGKYENWMDKLPN